MADGRMEHSVQGATLADILERILDNGVVIAGDITICLVGVELLSIRLRLLIASVEKAVAIGINWWESDPALSSQARNMAEQNRVLQERLDRLETLIARGQEHLGSPPGQPTAAKHNRPTSTPPPAPRRRPGGRAASPDPIADDLSTIVAGPYSAVVGGGPGPDLKGRSREDLGHLLIAHQKVIEQLMRTAPVLPVKFGTWMPDEKGIRELLERGRPLLDSTFAELKGCTQLEVSVTWDVEAVFADIAGDEAVARLKAQIADNGQAATTAQRLALGRLVKAALERRRAAADIARPSCRGGRCDRQSRRSRPRRLAPRPSSQDRRSGRSRPLSRDARRRVRRPIVLSLRRTDAARELRHARNRAPRKRRDGACRPHIGRRADGEYR